MFRPHRYHYLSKGTVSEQGLRPGALRGQRQTRQPHEEILAYQLGRSQVRLGRIPPTETVALPSGSQDISVSLPVGVVPPASGPSPCRYPRPAAEITSFDVLPQKNIDTRWAVSRRAVIQVRGKADVKAGGMVATESAICQSASVFSTATASCLAKTGQRDTVSEQ